jgi:HK97 family phage major capsid protein
MSRTVLDKTDDVEDIVIPDTPAALEEFLADKAKILDTIKRGQFPEFMAKYGQVVLKKNMDISQQVAELTQKGIADFLKDQQSEGYVPVDMGAGRRPRTGGQLGGVQDDLYAKQGLFNPQAMGAPLDKEFPGANGHAEFFNLIWRNYARNLDAEGSAKVRRIRNAFQSDVPSDGGFLIPENLRSEVLRIALESGIVRSRARVIPMESLTVPFPMIDTSTNVGSVYGGIVCYWTEESSTMTDSSPKFGRITLNAKKLTAYTQVPQELVADSIISFQPFISQIFPEAMAFYEDKAFIKGTGVGEPLGALTTDNPACIAVAAQPAQPSGTIVWENIIGMYARLLPQSMNRAVWVCSPDCIPELATMALGVGTGGSAVWLNNGVGDMPMTILGRPLIVSEKVPAGLGTRGDISLVDWSFYLVGDRQAMSASVSEHYRFPQDEMAFKVVERIDGKPWLQSPITPEYGGATLSPFVQLATRP